MAFIPLHNHSDYSLLDGASQISKIFAAFNSLCSSKTLPINCIPIGNPLVSKPQGILIAGSPAKLAGTVNKSDKYIESGSLTKSPFKKAVVGQVGVNKISTF